MSSTAPYRRRRSRRPGRQFAPPHLAQAKIISARQTAANRLEITLDTRVIALAEFPGVFIQAEQSDAEYIDALALDTIGDGFTLVIDFDDVFGTLGARGWRTTGPAADFQPPIAGSQRGFFTVAF